jgi:site-specific DNA-methyltransferase (adenine-specific)
MINSIIHGDCLEVMKEIPDKSIDMILCDLPYGTTACKWDTIIPFAPLWEQYERVIKDNGAIVLTASQPFTTDLINSNRRLFRYELIWEKERPTNIFNMKYQPGRVHENICVFYKNQPTYNPQYEPSKRPDLNDKNRLLSQRDQMNQMGHTGATQMKISDEYDPTIRNPRSVLKISRGTRGNKKLHPTQKPVALFEYLIKTYTNEGETVLDNCAGSFTTAIAALNSGRYFYCIEKEKKYVDIGIERIQEHQKQINLFEKEVSK